MTMAAPTIAVCIRDACIKCLPTPEELAMEGEPLPEERPAERKAIEGEPMSEEWTVETKSIEREPLPEERPAEGKSIGGELLPEEWAVEGKSITMEREGAGSHEAAGTTKGGSSKATAAKGRPRKPTAAKAAVNGRRAQSRGGRGNRRGGQSSHYIAHHDAPPFVRRRTPAFKYETRQFPPGCSVRHCRSAGNSQAP